MWKTFKNIWQIFNNMDGLGGHYSKGNKPDIKKTNVVSLTCGIKNRLIETESRMVFARGQGVGNGEVVVRVYKD